MDDEANLKTLIASMDPVRVPGEFVFVSADERLEFAEVHATVREREGVAYVVERSTAEHLGLDYDFVAGWITLEVVSQLDAVGLTAAVSAVLAAAGISCNVLAGKFHDHLLVPFGRLSESLELLVQLAARN